MKYNTAHLKSVHEETLNNIRLQATHIEDAVHR